MRRIMFKSKLHRLTVNGVEADSEAGQALDPALTIDSALLLAADIYNFEQVHVWNVTRGTRLTTYAVGGAANSGIVRVSGVGAHVVHLGDVIIVATFTEMDDAQARSVQPRVVFVDDENKVRQVRRG